jgi:site-specific recombinase XerD
MKHSDYPFRQVKLSYEDYDRGFLTNEEITKFRKVKTKQGSTMHKSQDIFLFCLETGFRIGDALNLKKSDVNDNVLNYFSQKSKQYEMMPLTKAAQSIIERQINLSTKEVSFVFDLMEQKRMNSPANALNEQKKKTSLINKNLKAIASRAKLGCPVSTHLARHSMATNALSKGLSYAEIQSILGHSDVKTTQIYAKVHNRMKIDAIKKLE